MLIQNESINAYHTNAALGCTACKKLHPELGGSPALFYDHQTGIVPHVRKACWDLGNAYHWYFLENHDFENRVAIRPGGIDFRNKVGKEWRDEQYASGRLIITQQEMDALLLVDGRLVDDVRDALSQGETLIEPTIRIERDGYTTQARPDAWNPALGIADDLKTTAKFDNFEKDAFKLGYHFQDAWIRKHILNETGELIGQFRFLVVETVSPYRSAIRTWDADALAIGQRLVDDTFEMLDHGFSAGYWPSDHLVNKIMSPPHWATEFIEYEPVDDDNCDPGTEVTL